jgi:hypothetical protein
MKTEDFERLKAICEKEGFDISNYKESDKLGTLIHVKPNYIWEGVEFVQNLVNNKVRKVCGRDSIGFRTETGNVISYINSKPSTEQAYGDQLRASAFELYEMFNEGDRFELPCGELVHVVTTGKHKFTYEKEFDWFFYGQVKIYDKGKWAKKLPKRIKVDLNYWSKVDPGNESSRLELRFSHAIGHDKASKIAKFAKEYLNND